MSLERSMNYCKSLHYFFNILFKIIHKRGMVNYERREFKSKFLLYLTVYVKGLK